VRTGRAGREPFVPASATEGGELVAGFVSTRDAAGATVAAEVAAEGDASSGDGEGDGVTAGAGSRGGTGGAFRALARFIAKKMTPHAAAATSVNARSQTATDERRRTERLRGSSVLDAAG
jgi:hypothetical protein